MQKVYSRINWENSPNTNTPLGENNLNAMDYALDEIDNRVVSLSGYQDRAAESEENAKTSENNAKQSELNAKQSELLAKEYKDKAFTYTPDGYEDMVDEVFGLDIKSSTKSPLLNTKNGGLRFNSIGGKSEQNAEPTPSNPVAVKNAFDCVEMMQGYYGVSTGVYGNSAIQICNKNKIPCKSGDVVKITTENPANINIIYYNGNAWLSTSYSGSAVNEIAYTVPTNATHFCFNLYNESGITTDTVGKVTLTINGKVLVPIKTTDENGKESTAYIKLSDSLRGIGDLKDEIVNQNGVWGVVRRIVKLTCNGSEGWGIGNPTYRFALSGLTGVADMTVAPLCTHLKGVITNRDTSGTLWLQNLSSGLRLNVFVEDYNNNLNGFKNWLASNPIDIEYASTTQTFEVLNTESQIALNSLETFNGATSISFDSVVQPTFEVEYGESKVGAYTLKSLLNSESNAIKIEDAINTMLLIGAE